jgi:hypothetical protein
MRTQSSVKDWTQKIGKDSEAGLDVPFAGRKDSHPFTASRIRLRLEWGMAATDVLRTTEQLGQRTGSSQ